MTGQSVAVQANRHNPKKKKKLFKSYQCGGHILYSKSWTHCINCNRLVRIALSSQTTVEDQKCKRIIKVEIKHSNNCAIC